MLHRHVTREKREADRIMAWLAGPRSAAALVCIMLTLMLRIGSAAHDFLSPMPHVLSMSVNPDVDLRDRSCASCNQSALAISCCGLCAFWENPLSQHPGAKNNFEGQCSARKVERLLQDLRGRGIDLEAFEPEHLFEQIKGRTVWLIGDSQASYWFLAMECFLKKYLVSELRQQPTEFIEANMWLIKYVEELPHRGSKRAEPRPAMCTVYQEGTRLCFIRIHKIEEAAHPVLRVLKRTVPNFHRDIAIVNAGLHYGVGDPAYRDNLEYFTRFVREHRSELATILWKDTSPQHFGWENGHFWWFDNSKGGSAGGPRLDKCRAFTEEELASKEVQEGGWFNQVAFEVMRASAINIFSAYNETLPLWDFHLKQGDCTHFCNPSGYELWTYLLKEKLLHLKPWLAP